MTTTPDPLWRQMLNRSDAALTDATSAAEADGAIAGAHIIAVVNWIREGYGHHALVRDGLIPALQRQARAAREAR